MTDRTTDPLLRLHSVVSVVWVTDVETVHYVLKSACLHGVLGFVSPLEIMTLCYVDPLLILLN